MTDVLNQPGVSQSELLAMVEAFNECQRRAFEPNNPVSNIFNSPDKKEIIRLNDKSKAYVAENSYMSVSEASEEIEKWKSNALAQYLNPKTRALNSEKIVLSLFDLSGQWSQPWVDAGYQVYRFDIQSDPIHGDVNGFSVEYFNELYGSFEGQDIYAVLGACPCTDFAVSGARHFAAKDQDGRTIESIKLVHQTLRTIEFFKPAIWAIENPVGRIENLGGLPPWRLSFDPNHLGDPYTKKTLIWGRFNADLPIAPVEPTEGSKMHRLYGGKSLKTKNARSVTPEGFSYGFFAANNAVDNPVQALSFKYDRLDREIFQQAIEANVSTYMLEEVIADSYYMDLDDNAAIEAIIDLIKGENLELT